MGDFRASLRVLWAIVLLAPLPAIAQTKETIPFDVISYWKFHNDDGWRQLEKGKLKRAEERFVLAIDLLRPYESIDRRLMARSYCDLARVLYHQGRYAEAEPLAKWALSVREADKTSKPDSVFQCLYVLGMIHKSEKHLVEAGTYLKRALEMQETNLEPGHPGTVVTLDQLASVYTDQARYVDAASIFRRILAIQEQDRPDTNLDLAATAEKYADVLNKLGRADADKWNARARTIRETVSTTNTKAKLDANAKLFKSFK